METDLQTESVIPQAGVIAFRRRGGGGVEVLLIRRMPDGGWGIPKGLIDPGCTAEEAAAIEALEEAGVEGELRPGSVGAFRYEKYGGVCEVAVYLLEVKVVHERFAEERIRERRWCTAAEAMGMVRWEEVRGMIGELGKHLNGGG